MTSKEYRELLEQVSQKHAVHHLYCRGRRTTGHLLQHLAQMEVKGLLEDMARMRDRHQEELQRETEGKYKIDSELKDLRQSSVRASTPSPSPDIRASH